MATQEQEQQVKEPTIPPSCRIEIDHSIAITSDWPRAKAVWTLAESPPLAMKEEHPKDAEIIRRLEALAVKRS